MRPGIWFKALRVPFFTATIIPVVIGSVMAWHAVDYFSWMMFFLMLLAAICVHAGLNLANDYFDNLSGNDPANKTPTPFSGGSRVIQKREISAGRVLFASILFFGIAIAIGLYLNYLLPNDWFLAIGIMGVFIAFFYTAPPLKFGYRGLGEILVGIGFGPLIIAASYLVQAQSLTKEVVLASVPIGMLVTLILLINEIPDSQADRKTKKMTWVVRFGRKGAKNIYIFLMVIVYLVLMVLVLYKVIPWWSLLALLTLPMALNAVKIAHKYYAQTDKLLAANKLTIGLHMAFGVLFALGFVVDKLF